MRFHKFFAVAGMAVALSLASVPAYAADIEPCEFEDGSGQSACYWDAETMGNRVGETVIVYRDEQVVSESTELPGDVVDSMARDVIDGRFGNGQARRTTLGSRYAVVQARVNELLAADSL